MTFFIIATVATLFILGSIPVVLFALMLETCKARPVTGSAVAPRTATVDRPFVYAQAA